MFRFTFVKGREKKPSSFPMHLLLRVGSKMSQVFLINVKETRRVHILFAKCPAFGTFANRLSEVIF
jgi:hypothetical protein